MVRPFAVPGGLMIDPFAGSGALLRAAENAGMEAAGCEQR
jgi:tRNA G10  N-methylase Trm11